jgi:SAM-dependent methyltransferase
MTDPTGNRRASYWDAKIRRWAASSYTATRDDLMSRVRRSIDARKEMAKKILKDRLHPGYTLADLGCGAGQFVLEAVRDCGARSGLGLDFSPEAIHMAEELRNDAGLTPDQAQFRVADVGEPLPEADLATGLGLLDWLEPDQIDALFSQLKGRRFLLSYSEKDWSPDELIHRVYLVWRLALFGKGVRAYHHSRKFILDLATKHRLGRVEIVSAPAMRFGRLMHNLEKESP